MKLWLSWSSGKDSAWSLQVLSRDRLHQVTGLLTTFNEAFDRVAMHAVRRNLVEQQAERLGIPLIAVLLPWPCSNEEYERRMKAVCDDALDQGVEGIAFGDLFLEEVRAYREERLEGSGLEPVFPLWGLDTFEVACEMVAAGVEARVTCVDPKALDPACVGRHYDLEFVQSLPDSVDPCGERGEFHTFVSAGPMFEGSIHTRLGDIVERDGFVFADLDTE